MRKIIALGIMLLFLGMTISSSTGLYLEQQSIKPLSSGNTLYVGGDGPGNYTKIQDAIDDASNGDTVFVFDNSSPYYERLNADKSINLIGEDRDTTVIDGKGNVIEVSADWVNISGFTIRNGQMGIYISSNYNTISGNNVTNNEWGIFLEGSSNNILSGNIVTLTTLSGIYLYRSYNNTISGNIATSNNECGINVWDSNNSTISGNNISNNDWGIYLYYSSNNTVSGNNVSNNGYGIDLESNYNNITNNNIQNNDKLGLFLSSANYNVIEKNNFIGNKIQAFFIFSWGNNWDENYWDNWIGFKIKLPIFPKVIIGFIGINFDWRPAQEPYDIEV